MKSTVKTRLLCASVCAVLSVPAWAYIDSITVIPPAPTVANEIAIRVAGGLPDPCWSLRCHALKIEGYTISIEVRADFDGGMCMPVILPYEFIAHVGRLRWGTWTVEVADQWDTQSVKFDVGPQPSDLPGDSNGDWALNIADAVYILAYLFAHGDAPKCPKLADANNDAKIDIADAVWLLAHLFAHGPPPAVATQCQGARDCLGLAWPIFCVGHWECVCGECRMQCEMTSCGDGYCDVENGETRDNCPDCKSAACRPVCLFIGTKSEGWYNLCGDAADAPTLIRYDVCADCVPECRACGSKSEGWYDSCTGKLITWSDCDCECE